MGRTYRRRKRGKTKNFYTCANCNEVIKLNSWLDKQGMRCNEKLVLAVFNDTGRGVVTKKKIYPGEELMNLPLNSTISVTTLLLDSQFCSIFFETTEPCLVNYKKSVSFQSLLAFYLTFLKVQGSRNKWFVYLESLPTVYTVPYFMPNELICFIDADIVNVVNKQKVIVNTSFHIFENILKLNVCNTLPIQKLKDDFTLTLYEWAYFTVNTRCVFMDLSKVIDLKNIEKSILNLVSDNTKISLCPYLDMINHSPNAKNETKLLVSKNIETISFTNLNEVLLSEVWFSIYTKNNFEPYTQVFICYGESHNLKLITEYGFYLPANDLDFVSFKFEDVLTFLSSKSVKLSREQEAFINGHGLNKDFYIDSRGLSFTFNGFLMVVKYYYDREKDVSMLLYSAALCSSDKTLNDLIKPMVENKLANIQQSISNLETYKNGCVILDNCIALMCQYVIILEKFIKC